MTLGIIAILGGVLTLIGVFAGKSAIIGVGALLLFFGFFVTSTVAIDIPTPLLIFLVILGVFIIAGRKK